MYSLSELQERVEQEIKQFELPQSPFLLYEPIRYILSIGGKRIRPVLSLMACNLFSDTIEHAMKPALGLEIFHNFTLLHDDIMDDSPLRRNHETVHVRWNDNIAILSGDAMAFVANQQMCFAPSAVLREVLTLFNQTGIEVCEGQQFDLDFETQEHVRIEQYVEMIRLKTSVLLATSLKTGAIIGKASTEDADRIYEFGINLGLAFQLQDDLLDVYGDTKTFGKQIGNDITSNKKTFLLIKALELAKIQQLKELTQLINTAKFIREEKIQKVTQIFDQLNIKQITEKQIETYFQQAMQMLTEINLPEKRKFPLIELAKKLMGRIS